jgi:hypothetical protein
VCGFKLDEDGPEFLVSPSTRHRDSSEQHNAQLSAWIGWLAPMVERFLDAGDAK